MPGGKKWLGMVERGILVSLCLLPAPAPFFLPLACLIRPAACFAGKGGFVSAEFCSFSEITMSWTIALATGCAAFYISPFIL